MDPSIINLKEDRPHFIMPEGDGIENVYDFLNDLKIKVIDYRASDIEFDVINGFPALVNALRRILISEVPTMAIEKVAIVKNSTVIRDELLAHRLGLVPLKANAKLFQFRLPEDTEGTDRDTLHFKLKVKCVNNPNAAQSNFRPENLYSNYLVHSSQIKWVPIGEQAKLYTEDQIGPVDDDIVLVKMRPGHEVNATMTAVKGIGRDHAKFSPVALATYRLKPIITLKENIEGHEADLLKSCFPPGVIEISEEKGIRKAYVANSRYDTCSRNFNYYERLKDKVELSKKFGHYIFNIESVCGEEAPELFKEAVKILKSKAQAALLSLEEIDGKKGKKKKGLARPN